MRETTAAERQELLEAMEMALEEMAQYWSEFKAGAEALGVDSYTKASTFAHMDIAFGSESYLTNDQSLYDILENLTAMNDDRNECEGN